VPATTKPAWELAAEELVRQVRLLLDGYSNEIESALGPRLGASGAHAQIRQLDRLVEALEIELWAKGTAPSRSIGDALAKGLKIAVGAAVATGASLLTTDLYHAATAAQEQADKVVECVVIEVQSEGVEARDIPNERQRPDETQRTDIGRVGQTNVPPPDYGRQAEDRS
jgi:hypothetical protein